ncbi:MAG: sulfatase-like hydrolase/transferase, partial [Planctomycetota bacterium]
MIPDYAADPENGIPGYKGWRLSGKPWRYQSDTDRDAMPDEDHAAWTVEVLKQKHDRPFALFTGFSRTHTPLYAPQKYFDKFPLDEIEVPKCFREGDLEDCAPSLANARLYAFRRYQMLHKHDDRPQLFKRWLQAYMACVSFIDDQVGTVLDGLAASTHAENTIVILTSDHGFHVGGKESLYKQTLWDSGTRIPLIVAGLEGMPEGTTCDQPVSLIDVYPTLVDLCELPTDPHAGRSNYPLDGHSMKPLLLDPDGSWSGPSVAITALPGKDHSQHREHVGTLYPHFSVRSKEWRYSLTSDGHEELYRYSIDPYEFTNLAGDPEFLDVKSRLKSQLIELRDGTGWKEWEQNSERQERSGFELLTEVKGPASIRFGSALITEVQTPDWTELRVRVAGNRCQVWFGSRVLTDESQDSDFSPGKIQFNGDHRNTRLRDLHRRHP